MKHVVAPEAVKMENKLTGTYPTTSFTDILAEEAIDHFINAICEKNRLVGSGLYTENEFKQLCDFTGFFSTDYSARFQWCKTHGVIEMRGRSTWSTWWYDSPIDHIVVVYGTKEINVKGYKDKKHVLEWHLTDCNSWDNFKDRVTDPLHVLDNDPFFFGRRDWWNGVSYIAKGEALNANGVVYILEDDPPLN